MHIKKLLNFTILFILLIEIIIIVFLIEHITKKQNDTIDVFFVNNKHYVYNLSPRYKYYYELKPNRKIDNLIPTPDWLRYKPIYTINKDGLHERYDYSVEKPKKTFRIAALGDSFTFGLFVNTNDNYPEQLEDLLNETIHCKNIQKFEVINLGINGYDLPYAAERYKLKGEKYNPDLILWLIKDEDFKWLNEGLKPKLQYYESKLSAEQRSKQNSPVWIDVWNRAKEDYLKDYDDKKIRDINQNALYPMKDYSGEIIFLGIPYYSDAKKYKTMIHEFILTKKSSYFYELPNIRTKDGVFLESHPNKKGYTLIAQSIMNYLMKNNLIQCN